jgi:sec-independent protein translocase protein TatB
MPDVLFILILALVIFGPKRLPEIMRQVAKFMAQFRSMSDDLKRQIQTEMLKIEMDERQKKAAVPAPPPQLPSATAAPTQLASQSPTPLDNNISAAG